MAGRDREMCVLRTDRGRHSDGTEIGEKRCGDTVLWTGAGKERHQKTASPAEQALRDCRG